MKKCDRLLTWMVAFNFVSAISLGLGRIELWFRILQMTTYILNLIVCLGISWVLYNEEDESNPFDKGA